MAAVGVHCAQRKMAHSAINNTLLVLRKYMNAFCQMSGVKTFEITLVTASVGSDRASIPGMKAMLFHLNASNVPAGPIVKFWSPLPAATAAVVKDAKRKLKNCS